MIPIADGEIAAITGDLTSAGPAVVTLTPADVAEVGEELAAYHERFAPYFARREQRAWAQVYLRSLLIADFPRKNVEAIALRVFSIGPHVTRQVRALQQSIGEGAWNDSALLAEHHHPALPVRGLRGWRPEAGALVLLGDVGHLQRRPRLLEGVGHPTDPAHTCG